MANFDDRKDAFEKKFAHDGELAFKIEARTAKLLGLWAAGKMGLAETEAQVYAKEVVAANLDEPGFDDIKRKVLFDMQAKNVEISDRVVDTELQKFHEKAREQIMAETGE
ncbi:MAG: DUF1476 domain-containing protein [Alphaproteobacteria bacterium]|nr:DUF1476 domain-containing protein [Alphaproteobacteria bacterium]